MVSVAGYSPSQQHGGPPSISMARSASSDASTFAQCQQQAQQQQHAPGTTTKSASRSHSHSQLQSQSHSLSSSVAAQAVSPSMSMSASASASASQLPNGSFGATSSPNSSGLPSSSNGYSNMPHSAFAVGGSHPPPGGPYHHHAPFANSNGSAQHMPPPHHGGTTGSAAYPPEVQAMMYAAYQQQQQHWSAQMAMVHAQNDPRRRAPSLPTASASAAYHHLQQQQQAQPFYPQQAFPQSQSMQFAHPQQQQQFRQPYPSPSFQQQPQHQQQQQQQYFRSHHSHSASSSPAGSPLPPRGASPLPPQQQQQQQQHSPLPHQQYQQQLYSPQPPFAVQQQQRPASPNSSQIAADQNLRRRTESSPNDARFQPPQAHAQAQVQGQVPPGAGLQPGAAAAAFRGRTDSGVSTRSAPSSGQAQSPLPPSASTSFRSASPASSDRASTPTQGAAGGRTTPTVASSSSSSSSSLSARPPILGSASSFPAGQSQGQGQQHAALQPPVNLVKSPSSPSLQAHSAGGAGLPRKASPLSQQPHNKRSSTPTQASPFSGDRGDESSHTASAVGDNAITHPVTAAAGSASSATTVAAIAGKGHQSTLSNASSVMTSSSTSPQTSSSSSASGKGSSMFRNKLRKALSLNELGNSSSSSLDSSKIGRASLTSNSSSSDTSHSTMEPRTPPNGASPVLPSRFAASSASNLHKRANGIAGAQDSSMGGAAKRSGGMRRQASESNLGQQGTGPTGAGGSLPSNSGRRFGLLNNKMNSSTDNISISSTVSSASVMLRKMGNLGKLARKSSVRSLSNMFHRGERERFSDTAAEAHSRATSDAVSEFGVPGASMANGRDRDHRQKGGAATPSVAYVTAELESGSNAQGMTPAEALVRKHQEKEAEEARKRAAAAAAAAAASSGAESPRSKLLEKEKEKLKASSGGKDKKKWGFGFNRSASSTSLRQEVASSAAGTPAAVDTVRQQQLVSVHSAVAAAEAARAPTPIVPSVRPSLDGIALDSWRTQSQGLPPGATLHHHDGRRAVFDDDEDEEDARQGEGGDDDDDEGFDDRTPRQSMEVLGDQSGSSPGVDEPYADWDGEPPNTGSYFEDDTASFTNATVSNTSGAVHAAGPEEYDDGGHDGRSGQRIPERPHKNAQPARGILKYARSYSQDNLTRPQPAFNRPRASSYDAPHQMSPPNQPGKLAALAQVIPSEAQVDGVDHHPRTAARLDTFSQAEDKENISPGAMGMPSGSGKGGQQHQQPHHGSPYGNPGFNNSVPVLSNLSAVHMQTRSMTGPHVRRKISFANNLSVHTTWPGNIYDRRGEQATCNRLTPQLAQRIKEELNAFKMEEMEVHHMSRNFTHFFI